MEKEMKKGPQKVQELERSVFNDEEQRRSVFDSSVSLCNLNCNLFVITSDRAINYLTFFTSIIIQANVNLDSFLLIADLDHK